MLTIVMYHYVRALSGARYPGIKALQTHEFEQQLDYLTSRYAICSLADVIAASRGEGALPDRACVLTFDDGLIDHFTTVFPRLQRRRIPGAFFVPAMPVLENRVLPVHKIHFILASVKGPGELIEDLRGMLRDARSADLPSEAELYERHARPGRFDGPDVMFIKALLQHALPEPLRTTLVDELFTRRVSTDEAAFARELYVSAEQVRVMVDGGMELGGHGYHHGHLDRLSCEEQSREIDLTVRFLSRTLGTRPVDWAMCYPYGSYDQDTVRLLGAAGCGIAVTTRPEVVSDLSNPLELGRLNTNDFPPKAPERSGLRGSS